MSDSSVPKPPLERPRVVLLRDYSANPWDRLPWALLRDRFDVICLLTGSNEFGVQELAVATQEVRAARDRLPPGRALAYAVGDRYDDLESWLADADIVHAAELNRWFSSQAATLRARLGFKLALTVWETIPGGRGPRSFAGLLSRHRHRWFHPGDGPSPVDTAHLILSAGRLVWEKGHQDVLRAVAALHRGRSARLRRCWARRCWGDL